jgi:hypothetical protein
LFAEDAGSVAAVAEDVAAAVVAEDEAAVLAAPDDDVVALVAGAVVVVEVVDVDDEDVVVADDEDVETAVVFVVAADVVFADAASALGGLFGEENSDSALINETSNSVLIRTAKSIHLFFMFFSIKTGQRIFQKLRTHFIWKSIYPIFLFSAFL